MCRVQSLPACMQGQTPNSSVTLQHLAANQPQAAFLIGDHSYADDSLTNCKLLSLTIMPAHACCGSTIV